MSTKVNVSHEQIILEGTYDAFIQNIEIVLNRLDPGWSAGLLEHSEAVK